MSDVKEGVDIFASSVEETNVNVDGDKNRLYVLPEGVQWFLAAERFGTPKHAKDCTANVVVRFLSWQISEECQSCYAGTGLATPGTLRNQLVVRFHNVPQGLAPSWGRVPCALQFDKACQWCNEKMKAEKRFTRDRQPENYFKDVIAPLKPKERILMIGQVYTPELGKVNHWETDGRIYAFEVPNFVRNGRALPQIINDRANDADKRIRIDKKSYAGYVTPVALNLTYTWPVKGGMVEKGHYSAWTATDALPLPVEAGGPDVSHFSKEWALNVASNDPASWIDRDAFSNIDATAAGQWYYDVFTGVRTPAKMDVNTADFGALIELISSDRKKFEAIEPQDFSYDMVEELRAIVRGILS